MNKSIAQHLLAGLLAPGSSSAAQPQRTGLDCRAPLPWASHQRGHLPGSSVRRILDLFTGLRSFRRSLGGGFLTTAVSGPIPQTACWESGSSEAAGSEDPGNTNTFIK